MESNVKPNGLELKLETAVDLNKILTGVILELKRGNVTHEYAKSVSLIADKINKNNVNQLQYKSLTKHKNEIEFFENETKPS